MTIAIHYTSVNLSAAVKEVFGIQVAISNWMKAFFRYGSPEKFNFLISDSKDLEEIEKMAADVKLDPKRLVAFDRRYARENFGHFDTIFRPDPHVQQLLWQRQQVPEPGFSFCGLAHAIGGLETGDLLERYCLSPSEKSDAIVCPSVAVKAAIGSFWDVYGDYIKTRFGALFKCPVQLPIIPLGIDIDRYEALGSSDKRADQRKKLGLSDDDIVLLWVGRLSHAIKAHPLAMYQAAERAAEKTGAKVHLIMLGYFVPEDAGPQFKKLAEEYCVKVKVSFIGNDDPRFPDGLWAAGDIFLSLIDNMQESFGLTPIEAMAVGIPRVISDWDGYRDSVTNGEDGFLIPTTQPPSGAGRALSELLVSGKEMYGGFLAKSALTVAVDQEAASDAIALLIKDKNKRKTIAEKARARVRPTYDWKHIIPAYENLWKELAAQRRRDHEGVRPIEWPSALPQVPDPYTMYRSYPTSALSESSKLTVSASQDMVKRLWSHEINVFAIDMMIPPDDTISLINKIASKGEIRIGDLLREAASFDKNQMWRTFGWLIKLGILRVTN